MTWLRLAKTIGTQGLRPRLGIDETGVLHGRVWPTDLDFNVHVNNGRYLTMADLGRIDWFLRTGMLRAGLKNGWRPIIATGCVRFSRPLKPWQRYSLHSNLIGWDQKWAFMEHRFMAANRAGEQKLFASVVIKGAFQGRDGVVMPQQLMQAMGVELASPPVPQWVRDWQAGEDAWRDETRQAPLAAA